MKKRKSNGTVLKCNPTRVFGDPNIARKDQNIYVKKWKSQKPRFDSFSKRHPSNFNLLSNLVYRCRTPNGRNGYCIEILECPELLAQVNNAVNNSKIKRFLLQSQCVNEEEGKYPVVCCESAVSGFSFSREIAGNAKNEADVKNNSQTSESQFFLNNY